VRLGVKTHLREVERPVKICNRLGLHARAAGKFRNLAAQYKCTIKLAKGTMEADAKSILGLMALEASKGSELILRAWGEDSEQAVEALCDLISNRFGEDE
jgi:phosphotransferase system HPr (HPr) family protein